jgi:hypothetical protein
MAGYYRLSRFCDEGCRDSYRTDRRCCLIYPPWFIGGKLVGHDEAATALHFCPYCNEYLSAAKVGREKAYFKRHPQEAAKALGGMVRAKPGFWSFIPGRGPEFTGVKV